MARAADGGAIPLDFPAEIPRFFIDPPITPRPRRMDTLVRDEFIVHFTGRAGNDNQYLPEHLTDTHPVTRLFYILEDRALLALEPFGRGFVYPSVCFCEGDEGARARLVSTGRYQPFGVAFHRPEVESWGARPLIYADADAINLIFAALWSHQQMLGDELSPEDYARLSMLRALLMRDWPGTEEGDDFFREHGLDFDIKNPNEWSHENEMRLVLPPIDRVVFRRAYWTFQPNAVAHLLLPAGKPDSLKDFAQSVAINDRTQWAVDVEVRLIGDAGRPVDIGPLGAYAD